MKHTKLDQRYVLKIGDKEYGYSVLDYVRGCIDHPDQADEAMILLAKATYWYSAAAEDFI